MERGAEWPGALLGVGALLEVDEVVGYVTPDLCADGDDEKQCRA